MPRLCCRRIQKCVDGDSCNELVRGVVSSDGSITFYNARIVSSACMYRGNYADSADQIVTVVKIYDRFFRKGWKRGKRENYNKD